MRLFTSLFLTLVLLTGAVRSAAAQDVVISNARVIVGNGQVIERGSIVVRNGRIASVAAGAPGAAGGRTIDAKGMTAMAGFIDAHRHIINGNTRSEEHTSELQSLAYLVCRLPLEKKEKLHAKFYIARPSLCYARTLKT